MEQRAGKPSMPNVGTGEVGPREISPFVDSAPHERAGEVRARKVGPRGVASRHHCATEICSCQVAAFEPGGPQVRLRQIGSTKDLIVQESAMKIQTPEVGSSKTLHLDAYVFTSFAANDDHGHAFGSMGSLWRLTR